MSRRRTSARALWSALIWMVALSSACKSDGEKNDAFASDLPASGFSHVSSDAGVDAGPSASEAPNNGDVPNSVIDADDVIQLAGNQLFALSRNSGLAIVDISNPKVLQIVGRDRDISGTPLEMYLRDTVAILIFNGWGQYAATADGGYTYVTTSKIVVVDITDPTKVVQLGSFDLPGTISDSRIAGDILYVVGHEDGSCWKCEVARPSTAVVSLNIADPRVINKVDELRYDDRTDTNGWQRSVTVTPERLYVAGPEYGTEGPVDSTIQVIDIADPGGDMIPSATLTARGRISSRWQIDESDGVLRVVSESIGGRPAELPRLQTFRIVSPYEFQPLAMLEIQIPDAENLQRVRFDGPRGYVITASRTDPLFTLDLSDAAQPKQVGMLAVPGSTYYVEPRGDRVVALGYDQSNPEGAVSVSLIDVTNLAVPMVLSRVNFGGSWGSLPKDEERNPRAFRIFDDLGLILVPFLGYDHAEDSDACRSSSVGGVQLVDFANETLTLRGRADSDYAARRALVHDEHLFSVSDQRVEAFDLTDRNQPQLKSDAIMASTVRYAVQLEDGVIARVISPDAGENWRVELARAADAENMDARLSSLDLVGILALKEGDCSHWWSIESYHAIGSTLYLLYTGRHASDIDETVVETGVLAIDASDPGDPRVIGQTSTVEPPDDGHGWSIYVGGGYGGGGQVTPYLWSGKVLAYFERKPLYYDQTAERTRMTTRLRVVDLRTSRSLHSTAIMLGDDREYVGLNGDGDQVITTRADVPAQGQAQVNFYAERIDVSESAAPVLLDSVNVPGVVVHYDQTSGRAVTSQFERVVRHDMTWERCQERFSQFEFEWEDPKASGEVTASGTCSGYRQSLQLITLSADAAVVEDEIALPDNRQVFELAKTGGRIFATLVHQSAQPIAAADCESPCETPIKSEPQQLLVLSGILTGKLRQGLLAYQPSATDGWRGFWGSMNLAADGDKALLFANDEVAIVSASNEIAPSLERTQWLLGNPRSVEIQSGVALISLGELGLTRIEM